jgi:hypothetical protein
MFDESLFFKKRARTYREWLNDIARINADTFYLNKRRLQPKSDFQTGWNVDQNMVQLCLANRNNPYAFEYALTVGLSNKQHAVIASDFDTLLLKFNYTHIPRHIEEALLINLNYGVDGSIGKADILNMKFAGLTIREETINRYDQFLKALGQYSQRQLSFSAMQERFGDTYWFHLFFIQLKPIELRGQPTYDIN